MCACARTQCTPPNCISLYFFFCLSCTTIAVMHASSSIIYTHAQQFLYFFFINQPSPRFASFTNARRRTAFTRIRKRPATQPHRYLKKTTRCLCANKTKRFIPFFVCIRRRVQASGHAVDGLCVVRGVAADDSSFIRMHPPHPHRVCRIRDPSRTRVALAHDATSLIQTMQRSQCIDPARMRWPICNRASRSSK